MNRAGIERALNSAVSNSPLIPFEQITDLPYVKLQEQDCITKQNVVEKPGRIRQFSLAAAFCLVLVVFLSGLYVQGHVSSVITLDVNPGIEIRTNLSDKVLSVRAINEDAVEILGSNEYKGTKLEELVPLLMNSLVEHQYINTDQNEILLTVTNRNSRRADAVRSKVDEAIRKSLITLNIAPTILSQKLVKEADRARLAKEYGLSEGKLSLIQNMIAVNSGFTLDNLAGKSIGQLYNLAKENAVDLSKYFITEEDDSSNKSGKTTNEDAGEVKEPQENNNSGKTEPGSNEVQNEDNSDGENEDQNIGEQDNQGQDNEDNKKKNEQGDSNHSRSGDSRKKDKSKDGTVAVINEEDNSDYENNQMNEDNAGSEDNQDNKDNIGSDDNQDNEDNQGIEGDQSNEDNQGNEDSQGIEGNQSNEDSQGIESNQGNEDNQGIEDSQGYKNNENNQGKEDNQDENGNWNDQGNNDGDSD